MFRARARVVGSPAQRAARGAPTPPSPRRSAAQCPGPAPLCSGQASPVPLPGPAPATLVPSHSLRRTDHLPFSLPREWLSSMNTQPGLPLHPVPELTAVCSSCYVSSLISRSLSPPAACFLMSLLCPPDSITRHSAEPCLLSFCVVRPQNPSDPLSLWVGVELSV